MNTSGSQSLQAFFDSPGAQAARWNLSASAAEALSFAELAALEPDMDPLPADTLLDYPTRHGSHALKAAIATRFPGIDPQGIVLTSGVDESLALLSLALVRPGDRVVVLSPCYPPQVDLPRWRGAEVVRWWARPEHDWVPDLDELAALLRTPTAMLVATFPQNPTGFMPDAAYCARLLELVRAHRVRLVSDEIYAGLPRGSDLPGGPLACQDSRALSLRGLSKVFGLPGLRVGWIATRDTDVVAALTDVHDRMNAYMPVPVEHLALRALRHEATIVARNGAILARNLEHADAFFARHDNLFDWRPPGAGVLAFTAWRGPGGARALSEDLLEHGVVLAPATCFDAGDGHVRFGLGKRLFADGLDRLDTFLARTMR